ncbi:hypothetical protein KM043_010987 [Ampulex compressa]|nr:hypothetical protein KM043_010987 [Ampulex compressa]
MCRDEISVTAVAVMVFDACALDAAIRSVDNEILGELCVWLRGHYRLLAGTMPRKTGPWLSPFRHKRNQHLPYRGPTAQEQETDGVVLTCSSRSLVRGLKPSAGAAVPSFGRPSGDK